MTAYLDALAALEQAAMLARAAARNDGHSTIPMTMVDAQIREARMIAQGEAHAADAMCIAVVNAAIKSFREAERQS